MTAFYNEIDPYAAQWLRNLIAAGLIAPGMVDERSIEDLDPDELVRFTQCHFFAGIGVWSHALRLAGWPDGRPVWTGSCPCQPFSAAGKGKGVQDERHLWPAWHRLIRYCRPVAVFGEQVGGPAGIDWLAAVHLDLQADAYAFGAACLPACSVGAPHIRERIFFVAHADGGLACEASDGRIAGLQRGGEQRLQPPSGGTDCLADADCGPTRQHARELSRDESEHAERTAQGDHGSERGGATGSAGALADAGEGGRAIVGEARLHAHGQPGHDAARRRQNCGMADADGTGAARQRRDGGSGSPSEGIQRRFADSGIVGDSDPGRCSDPWRDDRSRRVAVSFGASIVGDAGGEGLSIRERDELCGARRREEGRAVKQSGGSFWAACDWLPCRDGKARPVEPGTFPLAHGAPSRVGRLRAYGNAIVAPLAAEFIRAADECLTG